MPSEDHPPSFQFYPLHFVSDNDVDAMCNESVGMYMRLLCKAWFENPVGSLPNSDEKLARWARTTADRWADLKQEVLAAFTLGTDNRWHQKRMRREFDKLMAYRKERSQSGKKGANKRWRKKNSSANSSANGSAIEEPLAKNSSSSSSSRATDVARSPPNPPAGGERGDGEDDRWRSVHEAMESRIGRKLGSVDVSDFGRLDQELIANPLEIQGKTIEPMTAMLACIPQVKVDAGRPIRFLRSVINRARETGKLPSNSSRPVDRAAKLAAARKINEEMGE